MCFWYISFLFLILKYFVVSIVTFFIIKNLSFSYLGFAEAFSMLSTPWLTQVLTCPWTSHGVTGCPRKLIGSITSSDLTSLSLRNDFSLEQSRGFLKLLCGLLLLTGNHLQDLFWPRVYDIRRGTARIVILILILDLLLCFRKVSHGINEPSLNQFDTVIQTFFFC